MKKFFAGIVPKSWRQQPIASQLRHSFSALPLSPQDVHLVVDVGAFTGHYALHAAQSYPNATIVAFEPTPTSAKKFRENMADLESRVTLHECALSEKDSRSQLHVTTTSAANSLHSQSREHAEQNPHVRQVGRTDVSVRTLDGMLSTNDTVDILKIDVEGEELAVLHGGVGALARTRFVIIEISLARDNDPSEQAVFKIFSLLQQAGFGLYGLIDTYPLSPPQPNLGMAQFDAIFRNTRLSDA